jgi:hypothetical protein
VAAGAALLPVVLWTVQGLIDWLWEYPVLTVATVAFLGMALALGATPAAGPDVDAPPSSAHGSLPLRAGALVLAAATAVLLIPAWIAERDVARASVNWTVDRQAAYDRLERAKSLAPLDVIPPTVEGVIAARSGDRRRAESAFREAAERDPENWWPRFELALLAAERRDRSAVAARLREAQARNPREPLVVEALDRNEDGRPMTFAEVDERIRRTQ